MAWLDETGVETLATELKEKADEMYLPQILNLLYPIGTIYTSVNSTNPGTLFGGTWEAIEDVFLLSAGTNHAAGSTGGEANHVLTINELPEHSHKYAENAGAAGWSGTSPQRNFVKTTGDDGYTDVNSNGNLTTLSAGAGYAHNNMPPYLAVYMWKRIA